MKRDDWVTAVGTLGTAVRLEIGQTPIAGVEHDSSVVASVAHQFGPATARVSVYRYDSVDAPTPINKDDYEVWTDLGKHPRLTEMISAATTSDNENFQLFCREHVFFVKQERSDDHWLAELPASVKVLMKST